MLRMMFGMTTGETLIVAFVTAMVLLGTWLPKSG